MGLCVNETRGTVVTGLSHVRRIWAVTKGFGDDHQEALPMGWFGIPFLGQGVASRFVGLTGVRWGDIDDAGRGP